MPPPAVLVENMNRQRLFGLIGYPLGHSFSKRFFEDKFEREGIQDCAYELFPLEDLAGLTDLFRRYPELVGLNVTIPHKTAVMAMLDELDPEARVVGAVNTILIRDGRTRGFNTDITGFDLSLEGFLPKKPLQALILGTGGSSRAVAWALKKRNIPYRFVSRNPRPDVLAYSDLQERGLNEYQLIVNCTPLGMYPHVESFPPLPYENLDKECYLYDLVYNPEETWFLRKGRERGCQVKNGLEMLHLQAQQAWEIWNK